MRIDNEFKNLIPALMQEEKEKLEESIKQEGVRDPLIVWKQKDILLDGHNRKEIADRLKIKYQIKKKSFKDRTEAMLWVINNQLARRNLSDYSRTVLSCKQESILKSLAKTTQGHRSDLSTTLTKSYDTRKTIAKKAGVSEGTVSKVKLIEAKADKETKKKLYEGKETINKVYTIIKRKEIEDTREQERKEDKKKAGIVKSPEELFKEIKFTTVVIDPPWDWGDEGDINQLGRAKPNYNTIPFKELKKLPIGNITKKDAHIYLWITNRSLSKGFELLKEWGCRYITCLTWCKPSFGMGNYFRGSTEQILFGVKGSLPLKRKDVGTWFQADRGKNGHSSKPEEFYKLVEECSYGLYLDYFGRKEREGWYVYGNEIKEEE